MADDNYGLLIAAIVAIVAVVGLVILFSGAKTGAPVADVYHPNAMQPCDGQMVGSTCTTAWVRYPWNRVGVCVSTGPLAGTGSGICGVDAGCFCDESF